MFRFKQFSVDDTLSPMKVGTDGVLLGAWFEVNNLWNNILDLGTGCGVIALMAAQRTAAQNIVAIDVDAGCVADATENVLRSPWADRITVRHISLNDYVLRCGEDEARERSRNKIPKKFDAILSNPPYYSNALAPADAGRAGARHTASLGPGELAEGAAALLAPDGAMSLILPPDEAEIFLNEAACVGLRPVRITEVYSRINSLKPKRILMKLRHSSKTGSKTEPTAEPETAIQPIRTRMAIHGVSGGGFTEEYVALTRDFYLKF